MRRVKCIQCNNVQDVSDNLKVAFCNQCGKQYDLNALLKTIKCPSCNSSQSVNANSNHCFCKYCGYKIENINSLGNDKIHSGTAITCPACAATVKNILQDSTGKYAVCDHCGTRIIVDYHAQEAYEVEKAKIKAREDTHKTLLDALIEIEDAVLNTNDKYKEQNELVKKIGALNRKENQLIRRRFIEMYIYSGLIASANFLLALLFRSPFGYLFFGILSIGAFLYFTLTNYKKGKDLAIEIEDQERDLLEVINVLNAYNEILSRHPDIVIPKDMMTKDAYDCVLGIIAENNIDTLAEAVSLYRYWKQKNNSKKMKEAINRREKEKRVSARESTKDWSAVTDLAAGIGVGLFAAGALIKSLID